MAITIGQNIRSQATDNSGKPFPNIDDKYGPYASTAAALTAISKSGRAMGLTVGIITNGIITEYWFQGGVDDANLLPKVTVSENPVIIPSSGIPELGTVYKNLFIAYSERIDDKVRLLAVKTFGHNTYLYEEGLGMVLGFGLRLPSGSEIHKIISVKNISNITYYTDFKYWTSSERIETINGVDILLQEVISMGSGVPSGSFKNEYQYLIGIKELIFDLATEELLLGNVHDTKEGVSSYNAIDGNTWLNTKTGVLLTSVQGTWAEF